MSVTTNLGISEVAPSQNQKEETMNDALEAMDGAISGMFPVVFTSNAATLTSLQYTRFVCFQTGTQTASATLTVPLTKRLFVVDNTTGTFDVTVGGATGATVGVAATKTVAIFCNGTDCISIKADLSGTVSSVVGHAGVVTLSQLVAAGLLPTASPTPTGTVDASGATSVLVPTVAGSADSSTKAASTAFVQAVAAALASGLVSSVVGSAGAVTLAELVAAGLLPTNDPTPTGTLDASASTAVKVPTIAGSSDSTTNAASTAFVQAVAAVLKAYVDAGMQGLQIKPTATVATTAALATNSYNNGTSGVGATITITATGTLTIDSHLMALNESVVVKDEATPSHNGLYNVTTAGAIGVSAVLTRSVDMQSATEFSGAFIPVGNVGTTNANTIWLANPGGTVTVGITSIPFTQLNSPTNYTPGTGITVSGLTIALASIADATIMANISGGSAAPTPHSITAILDALLGNTDGDIAVRVGGTWTAAGTLNYTQLPTEVANALVTVSFSGVPDVSQDVIIPLSQAMTMPANFAGTVGYADNVATADTIFTVAYIRAGVTTTIGTITFLASSNSATLSTQSSVALLPADALKITAPAIQDLSLSNCAFTIMLIKS